MPRVSRLIIYDSDNEEALKEQIEKSLPEGVHDLAVKITIVTLKDMTVLGKVINDLSKDFDDITAFHHPI